MAAPRRASAAVCVAQIGMFGVIRVNAQLRAAREELAEREQNEHEGVEVRDVPLLDDVDGQAERAGEERQERAAGHAAAI